MRNWGLNFSALNLAPPRAGRFEANKPLFGSQSEIGIGQNLDMLLPDHFPPPQCKAMDRSECCLNPYQPVYHSPPDFACPPTYLTERYARASEMSIRKALANEVGRDHLGKVGQVKTGVLLFTSSVANDES